MKGTQKKRSDKKKKRKIGDGAQMKNKKRQNAKILLEKYA